MKVLLINPSSHTKYPSPPLGLLQLAACLKMDGHEVKVSDLNIDAYIFWAGWPDVVGITAVTPTINEAIEVANRMRVVDARKPIIIGGPHATLMPEETLKLGCFDFAAVGEFDYGLRNYLEAMDYFEKPSILCSAISVMADINKLPMPDYSLIDISKYHPHPPHGRKKPWLPMITSRGCPYSCSFCSKPVFGSKYRAMDADHVINQIIYLQKTYGVKEITFYDDVFTLDKIRTVNLMHSMRNLELDWSCESRVNLVRKPLLQLMKAAGCFLIAYGLESGSPEILKNLNKGATLEQAEEAIAYTREAGIQTVGYFMIGNPGETKADIEKTINFAIKLKLDYAQFAITIPLPGSQLYDQYISQGYCMPDWGAFTYANMGRATIPLFNAQNLTSGDIKNAINTANRRFYLRLGYMLQRGLVAVKSWSELKILIHGVRVYLENTIGK